MQILGHYCIVSICWENTLFDWKVSHVFMHIKDMVDQKDEYDDPKIHIFVVSLKPCHKVRTKVCCFLPKLTKALIMVFLLAKLHAMRVICAYSNLLYSQISQQNMIFHWKLYLVEVVTCLSAIFKMIYSSFLDTCLNIFAPKFPIELSVFDQIHSTNFINFIQCLIIKVKATHLLVRSTTFAFISGHYSPVDPWKSNSVDIKECVGKGKVIFFHEKRGAYEGGDEYSIYIYI